MLVRCDECQGKKVVMGLGCMQKDCSKCKAIGWLDIDVVVAEQKVDLFLDDKEKDIIDDVAYTKPPTYPRRGRQKRVVA